MVSIDFTEAELQELLGTVKVKQMRIQLSGPTIESNEQHVKNIRKMKTLKALQAKIEQGALSF